MLERTCSLCHKKYSEDSNNWYNSICCYNCYKNKNSEYKVNDKVYTYDNIKRKDKTGFDVILTTGTIINIYENFHVTSNGLYQYAISLDNRKHTVFRFKHQISYNKKEIETKVDIINKTRVINRQANNLIKNIKNLDNNI